MCVCLDLVSGNAESLCKEIKNENKAVSDTCRSMQEQALTEPGEMLTPCFSPDRSVSSKNSNRHCIILNCLIERNAGFRLGLSLLGTMENIHSYLKRFYLARQSEQQSIPLG